MAEIKTGIFAKNVQKRLNRAQEKVLQKLGKADETKDEQFEQVVINFRRQESEGSRLQREMKTYMSAIKGMQQASINLTQSLHEVYEPDWHGKDDVMTIGKDCDALWEDFHNKLVDSTLLNLDAYLQQFPDLKTRVAKRSRKLIDYDSARHHVETLQASGMKNDRKIMKAEDELKKAQRVFDELNVGLQDELPTLWDSRVGFYINTYKSVTSLEAKFHREISLVCRQLYEVMTKLAEQHSDKMFTIQGAPSDSGPLRLARTPSPPEDESPPESPDASSNHMLRPVSPGPPRPKSPTQFKKGPPVPPPPKVTPTKEVAEEQIIDLFGGEFLPAPSPSQPNERPGESLLDLDFDAFQPDESVSPIPQTAIPWDMWSANTQTAQPQAADAGFMADWSADFGAVPANGDASSRAEAPEAPAVGLEGAQDGAQGGAQGWPQADGWLPGGNTATPPQESEAATAAESEVSKWDSQTNPNFHPTAVRGDENKTGQADSGGGVAGHEDRRTSTPGLIFTNEYGEQIEDSTEDRREKWARSPDGSGSEYETAEEWGDGGLGGGWASADDELSYEDRPPVSASEGWAGGADGVAPDLSQTVEQVSPVSNTVYGNLSETHGAGVQRIQWIFTVLTTLHFFHICILKDASATSFFANFDKMSKVGSPSSEKPELSEEKMPIPSVVIEPASSNEGDDDRDADIISPTAISDNEVTAQNQTIKHMSPSGAVSGLPDDFLYKVETMHDFEAANSDELELKRGDVVLVVPTASVEDQDAGWLTGIKESDWVTLGAGAQKGLFPENFTQHLE
ncbi:amphiphysin isoform X6 [Trachinotus anak]|uniref:amphiphysin isoform X6 n=1 Tax=Trachinotus anak TaxID=443729 RepID=UPI0039F1E822